MARFRATIRGQRGEASRLGSSKSGIVARVNGWDAGIEVDAHDGHSPEKGSADVFDVYMTSGSNHRGRRVLLGRVYREPGSEPLWEGAVR